MGCVCCSLSSFVSILLDACERITLCTVCALLTCCLLFTILTVMVMGIGIGYHYCFVQNSVEAMEKAARAAGALRSGMPRADQGHMMRSVDKAVKRGFAHRVARRDANTNYTLFNRTDTSFNGTYTIYNDTYVMYNDTHVMFNHTFTIYNGTYTTFNDTNDASFNKTNITAAIL